MDRTEVTRKILAAKVSKGIKWADVAEKLKLSKEWTTAACLGQMTLDAGQAAIVGGIFGLDEDEIAWLQVVPYKPKNSSSLLIPERAAAVTGDNAAG